jgi:UDP-2,3-diacylglucosamine hydrolase
MTKKTAFISDLHLDKNTPKSLELLKVFLELQRDKLDALYLLGDIFEHWIGDDATDTFQKEVIALLRSYSDHGIKLFVIVGNRDFLIGKSFMDTINATLLSDPFVANIYGQKVLLSHGDLLCTLDKAYQRMRKILQSALGKKILLSLSVKFRQGIAERLRKKSTATTTQKKSAISMDVEQKTVESFLSDNDCTTMVHGHTHKPGDHHFTFNNKNGRRIVLGSWYEGGSAVFISQDKAIKLVEFDLGNVARVT